MADVPLFSHCPLCESSKIAAQVRSLSKDMSLEGFIYCKCAGCGSYYEGNVTTTALHAFYDTLSAYESSSEKTEIVRELAETLDLKGHERTLDLGCGSGAWALPMLAYCGHLTCVDLDVMGLEKLVGRVAAADRHRVASHCAQTLEFIENCEASSFDLVLSMFSLEHDPQPRRVLAHVHRILKPGGRALVLVPSADALQLAILGAGFYWFQAPWHTFIPTGAGLRTAAAHAGFSQCRPIVTDVRFYSWFWIRGLADRLGLRSRYDALRRFKWFVTADIAIDELLDRVSFAMRRPSYGLYLLER